MALIERRIILPCSDTRSVLTVPTVTTAQYDATIFKGTSCFAKATSPYPKDKNFEVKDNNVVIVA